MLHELYILIAFFIVFGIFALLNINRSSRDCAMCPMLSLSTARQQRNSVCLPEPEHPPGYKELTAEMLYPPRQRIRLSAKDPITLEELEAVGNTIRSATGLNVRQEKENHGWVHPKIAYTLDMENTAKTVASLLKEQFNIEASLVSDDEPAKGFGISIYLVNTVNPSIPN